MAKYLHKRKRVALYARVSTGTQTVENQLQKLYEVGERFDWNITAEFVDHGVSGAKGRGDRPQLDAMLKAVVRGEFDLVASWSVDRLGRSLVDLLETLRELHAKDVDLYLDQQGVDSSTPSGRAMFQMLGVFAEFERAMIEERVRAGLARARSQGVVLGRPKVKPEVEDAIRQLKAEGRGILSIAKTLKCGVSTVQRVMKA